MFPAQVSCSSCCTRRLCHPRRVLSSLRGPSGGPSLLVRVLALVVALLLAGPLTVAMFRGAAAAVRLAL